MSFDYILHTPDSLPNIDATISEDNSYYLHTEYEKTFPDLYKYDNSKYHLNDVIYLINNFAIFHSKVKLSEDSRQNVSSRIPLEVFRYKRLPDGSWYYVKTIPTKYKDGDIIEGSLWSNGMYFIIRNNKNEIIEACLYIDQYTKDFYKYP